MGHAVGDAERLINRSGRGRRASTWSSRRTRCCTPRSSTTASPRCTTRSCPADACSSCSTSPSPGRSAKNLFLAKLYFWQRFGRAPAGLDRIGSGRGWIGGASFCPLESARDLGGSPSACTGDIRRRRKTPCPHTCPADACLVVQCIALAGPGRENLFLATFRRTPTGLDRIGFGGRAPFGSAAGSSAGFAVYI